MRHRYPVNVPGVEYVDSNTPLTPAQAHQIALRAAPQITRAPEDDYCIPRRQPVPPDALIIIGGLVAAVGLLVIAAWWLL